MNQGTIRLILRWIHKVFSIQTRVPQLAQQFRMLVGKELESSGFVWLNTGDIQRQLRRGWQLADCPTSPSVQGGPRSFRKCAIAQGTRRCRPCLQWPGARSSAWPCNACTHGFCDLCRRIARSAVRARKSCSNVPSWFLPATENKIINQETPDRREKRSMAGQRIDRDKLRAAIRRMGSEYVF
jgi:hypothetical protein